GNVYLRNLDTGATTRVSRSPLVHAADTDGSLPALCADGRFIVFSSSSALVPDDLDENEDVFLYDQFSDTVRRTSPCTGPADCDGGSYSSCISGDGSTVAF